MRYFKYLYLWCIQTWNHFGVIGSGTRGPIAQGLERSADNGEVSRSSRLRPTNFLVQGLRSKKCEKYGDVAQLVERPLCTRKASGPNPLISTIYLS